MPEIGTSGSMSGDGKQAIGKASSTAPILDSTAPRPPATGLSVITPRPNRCGGACRSFNDDLEAIACFQLLVGLEVIQYLESFDLMIEGRHPARK